jgi:hypothetical protein
MFPRPDPWEEQRHRDREHRAAKRRRRRRWLIPLSIVLVLGAAVAGLLILSPFGDDGSSSDSVVTSAAPSTTESVDTAPPPTVPPERLVEVSEVWLLDRGDGVFDWGLSVLVPSTGPTRSGVEVEVTLLDDRDDVVDTFVRTLDGVNSLVPSTAAGRLVDPDRAPTRLDFDITVGVPSDDLALDALLSTRAVRRDGDELTGRIRSSALDDITDISMVMVWRSDEAASADSGSDSGDEAVVAVVVYEIERIRPGVDAQFSIDLDEQRAPEGVPDAVLWSPSS